MRAWAERCVRWRWWIIAAWVVVAVVGGAVGGQIFDRAVNVSELSPDAESIRADHRLEELDPHGPLIIAITKDRDAYDPELVQSTASVHSALSALPMVAKVEDLGSAPGGFIGADTRTTMIRVETKPGLTPEQQDQIVAGLHRLAAPKVLVGGEELAEREFGDRAVSDAALGESVALGLLVVLLLLIFRQWMPMVITLGGALATITATLLVLTGMTSVTSVSEYAVNVVTLLGLGLSVDYALLLVWRFREEGDVAAAVGRAGRAVLISGGAVSVALIGLMLFAEPLLASMALGGLVATLVATAVALTLVPALLAVGHSKIRLVPPAASTLLGRLAGYAIKNPGPVAATCATGLILLALPFLEANLGNSEARALPLSSQTRQVFEEVQHSFQHDRADPVTVVVESNSGGQQMLDYLNRLNHLEGLVRLQLRLEMPQDVTVIDLTPEGVTGGVESRRLVRLVREIPAPAPILVGGPAAEVVDYQDAVADQLPLVLLVLFLAMGLLLYALTGSVLIPLKALLLNALTLVASLGVLVMAFQWGWAARPLGFTSWGGLDLTTPVLLFVFIFGLSMDYEVFLLSRITEEWRAHGDNDRAIVTGLTRTGPVVTAAAACLTVVFLGFLLGDLVPVKEIGLGMAVAIVLDVTVARGLLLPALMKLLGRWNWWSPSQRRDRALPQSADGP